ncbi:MAG: TetR/AcrR family transcriptional regulator C-terminal domain-containing protein, partial [Acidobacteriota bacterium]
ALVDESGIESLSMRKLGQALGVQAMSLYNHVANKDEILDGIVERVVGEFVPPPQDAPWREALRETAKSMREVLLRHPWAAALVESRVTPSPVRFRHSDAVIGTLRRAGFSIELAYRAQLTFSSYVYGFTLQEVNWPFDSQGLPDVVTDLQPRVPSKEYPYLSEMMTWLTEARSSQADPGGASAPESEFELGLDLVLDGLETLRSRA